MRLVCIFCFTCLPKPFNEKTMKIAVLICLLFICIAGHSQLVEQPARYEDTISLKDIRYKKVVAYYLEDAVMVVDHRIFLKKLKEARATLLKEYRLTALRIQKRLPDNFQLLDINVFNLQEPLDVLDSVIRKAKAEKSDTFRVYRQTFTRILPTFGDFLPALVEKGECAVFDMNDQRHFQIIRRRERANSAEWVKTGPPYYYLPGASRYFMSPVDWIEQKPPSN